LDLYHATLDSAWLEQAIGLQGKQDQLFLDTEQGGYFTSRQGDEFIIIRLKEDQVRIDPDLRGMSSSNWSL
jgi:uncharacterized protein YyaL (SSP411 family)